MLKKIFIFEAVARCALQGFAQGTAFTYQGRLSDARNPANGFYDLRFALFNAASGGTQQGGTLTVNAQGVTNGLFIQFRSHVGKNELIQIIRSGRGKSLPAKRTGRDIVQRAVRRQRTRG